jgi:hypothetical protein
MPLNLYGPATIEEWLARAQCLFAEIKAQHGSLEARRIFTQCAKKPPTSTDKKRRANAELVWGYLNMPKPNMRQLAIRLAKKSGEDHRNIEKRIERARNNKRVRAYIKQTLFEIDE